MADLMDNSWAVGLIMFACLFGAAMASLVLHKRLPAPSLTKETQDVMKLGVGMIIAMSTLVLGLLTASVKGEFDSVNSDIKQFATEIVLLDRTLRIYGGEADGARQDLVLYVRRALAETWPQTGQPVVVEDTTAEALLDRAEARILALKPAGDTQDAGKLTAVTQIQSVVQQRWKLIEEAQNTISPIMVWVLIFWLSVTFASFGYNAPKNRIVIAVFFLCAASIGGAMFLILELDGPFGGLIQVSPEPLQMTLNHMLHHQDEHVTLPAG
jgi:hypothetical protein